MPLPVPMGAGGPGGNPANSPPFPAQPCATCVTWLGGINADIDDVSRKVCEAKELAADGGMYDTGCVCTGTGGTPAAGEESNISEGEGDGGWCALLLSCEV